MTGLKIHVTLPLEQASDMTPALSDADLKYFCTTIEDLAGIALKPSKRDLVKTRLRSRLTQTKSKSYLEYRKYLESLPKGHDEWQALVNLLTTNKTDFFREAKHFDFLVANILPAWLKTNATTFNIWSAASSTGEEAYTLAMVLERYLPRGRNYHIHATDIDTEVINSARNAVYPAHRRDEIPPEYYAECLDFGRGSVRDWFRIKKALKDKVSFAQHNLIDSTRPSANQFDLVLCRNVLIYFAARNIEIVCRKLHTMTKDDGHLFIGHSESFQGIDHPWTAVGPSIYRKR